MGIFRKGFGTCVKQKTDLAWAANTSGVDGVEALNMDSASGLKYKVQS